MRSITKRRSIQMQLSAGAALLPPRPSQAGAGPNVLSDGAGSPLRFSSSAIPMEQEQEQEEEEGAGHSGSMDGDGGLNPRGSADRRRRALLRIMSGVAMEGEEWEDSDNDSESGDGGAEVQNDSRAGQGADDDQLGGSDGGRNQDNQEMGRSQLAARHLVAAFQRDQGEGDQEQEDGGGHQGPTEEAAHNKSAAQQWRGHQGSVPAGLEEDTSPAEDLCAPSFSVFNDTGPFSAAEHKETPLHNRNLPPGRPTSAHPGSRAQQQAPAVLSATRPASSIAASRGHISILPPPQGDMASVSINEHHHHAHHHQMYSTLRISVDPASASASLDVLPQPGMDDNTPSMPMPSAFAFPAMPFGAAGIATSQSGPLTYTGHSSHFLSLSHSVIPTQGSESSMRPASAPPLPPSSHFVAHRRQRQKRAPSRAWVQFSGSASNFLTPSLTEDHFLELQEGAPEGGSGEGTLATSGALQGGGALLRAAAFALTPLQQQRQAQHSSPNQASLQQGDANSISTSSGPTSAQPLGHASSSRFKPGSLQGSGSTAKAMGGGLTAASRQGSGVPPGVVQQQQQVLDHDGLPSETKVSVLNWC
jgi:hypothetical protein